MSDVLEFTKEALWLVLLLSGPPVAAAALIGLVVAFLQAATQLQEQTLPFGAKMLAVVLTVLVLLGWMSRMLIDFGILVFTRALGV